MLKRVIGSSKLLSLNDRVLLGGIRCVGRSRIGGKEEQQSQQSNAVVDKDPWKQVIDKQTGLPYWWNPQTGQTTAVGEAKPSGVYTPHNYNYQQVGFFGNFVRLVALGFGFGVMAIMLRMLLTGGFRQ